MQLRTVPWPLSNNRKWSQLPTGTQLPPARESGRPSCGVQSDSRYYWLDGTCWAGFLKMESIEVLGQSRALWVSL